jgi:transposase
MSPSSPPRSPSAKRRQHTKAFKEEAVRLAQRADVGFTRAAKDLGIHESLLRSWAKKQSTEGSDAFRGHGRKAALEAEIARLQRENRTLTMERDILKKAAAYFAKESQ